MVPLRAYQKPRPGARLSYGVAEAFVARAPAHVGVPHAAISPAAPVLKSLARAVPLRMEEAAATETTEVPEDILFRLGIVDGPFAMIGGIIAAFVYLGYRIDKSALSSIQTKLSERSLKQQPES